MTPATRALFRLLHGKILTREQMTVNSQAFAQIREDLSQFVHLGTVIFLAAFSDIQSSTLHFLSQSKSGPTSAPFGWAF
jgi:hypothetical protein